MRVTPEALKHELAGFHEQRPQLVLRVPVLAAPHHSEDRSLPVIFHPSLPTPGRSHEPPEVGGPLAQGDGEDTLARGRNRETP